MEKYYIGFYTSDGKDKIKGNWKLSEEEVQQEADSVLFRHQLGYILTAKASIPKEEVEKIAKEKNLSIGDVLSCL
jgi:hypothetical protein